jgi:hypothetical protein
MTTLADAEAMQQLVHAVSNNQDKFKVDPKIQKIFLDAQQSGKRFSKPMLDDIRAMLDTHRENGCEVKMWSKEAIPRSSAGNTRPYQGIVVAGDEQSDYCLICQLSSSPADGKKNKGSTTTPVYHFAKREAIEGTVTKGAAVVSNRDGKLTTNLLSHHLAMFEKVFKTPDKVTRSITAH